MGRPDGPFLAGNRVRAPPQSLRGQTSCCKLHPILLAAHSPDEFVYKSRSSPRVVREKGSHARPLARAPGLFCSSDGRLGMAALALSPELLERTPGCLSQEKETPSILVNKKKKKLSGRTFPVQASGCRLRREALECSFPLGVSSVFGEGKRFDYVMDLARTPEQSDLEKTLKKLLPLFLVQTISQPSPQFPVSCGAGQAVLHLIQ